MSLLTQISDDIQSYNYSLNNLTKLITNVETYNLTVAQLSTIADKVLETRKQAYVLEQEIKSSDKYSSYQKSKAIEVLDRHFSGLIRSLRNAYLSCELAAKNLGLTTEKIIKRNKIDNHGASIPFEEKKEVEDVQLRPLRMKINDACIDKDAFLITESGVLVGI